MSAVPTGLRLIAGIGNPTLKRGANSPWRTPMARGDWLLPE
jgi:hypothetical protein